MIDHKVDNKVSLDLTYGGVCELTPGNGLVNMPELDKRLLFISFSLVPWPMC